MKRKREKERERKRERQRQRDGERERDRDRECERDRGEGEIPIYPKPPGSPPASGIGRCRWCGVDWNPSFGHATCSQRRWITHPAASTAAAAAADTGFE